ncbi:MAG: DUF1949 domain-containing protein, partial [Clostridium baratii]|nr:DUF1949 domain-containing protein [Clostridium baratii]
CGQNNWHIEDSEYTDKVTIFIYAENEVAKVIEKEVIEATNGKAIINKSEEDIYFKENNRLFKAI